MACIFPCGVYRIAAAAAAAASRLRLWGTYRIDIVDADPEVSPVGGDTSRLLRGWTEPRQATSHWIRFVLTLFAWCVVLSSRGAWGARTRVSPSIVSCRVSATLFSPKLHRVVTPHAAPSSWIMALLRSRSDPSCERAMAIRGVEVIASRERCSVSVASCDEPVQSNIVIRRSWTVWRHGL